MIFPGTLKKVNLKFHLTLATLFVLLNVFVFLLSNIIFKNWPTTANLNLQSGINGKNFSYYISQMYIQSLDPTEKKLVQNLSINKMATRAIKDQRFWAKAANFPFLGDQIQIEQIKKVLADLKFEYKNSVQFQFGLGPTPTSPWAWVTYQFTHFSLMHLLSNIIFIFLIITYLQQRIEAVWIVGSGRAGSAATPRAAAPITTIATSRTQPRPRPVMRRRRARAA